ncbi:hypothetical protein [Nocardia sp. NPDC051832]|uniref:hypothetical protein n=1 Tax=Nocardia sp. NPDC051832 TaxID=3155673 RepID=UPI00342B95DB
MLAALVACAGVLGAGFVGGPRKLAGADFADESELRDAFRVTFVEYWNSGGREFTPGLARVVDYWFRYHLIKAGIAAGLAVVLVALGVLLWRRFLRGGGSGAGVGGVVATALALLSLVLVAANVQGAMAPFASLFPMLTGAGGPAGTLGLVRELLGSAAAGPPALDAMVGEFARYHVVMAVEAGVLAVAFLGFGAALLAKFAKTADRRGRFVLGVHGGLGVVLSLAVVVVAVANTTNAADPEAGLLALFSGGW